MKSSRIAILLKYSLVVCITIGTPLLNAKKKKQNNFQLLERLKLKENDEKGNEARSAKAEYLIRKSEIKAIQQLKALIKKHKGQSLEPDLLFRLTELYMRRVKAERFFEVHRKSNVVTALLPKIVKSASSIKYIKKSIKIYDYIIKKFPTYNQRDLILFNNAFARQEIADYKNADILYWNIIKNHPKSELVPDAHLAIGEIAFMKKKFNHALKHFQAIKKYPHSRVYPYGLYKTAWSLYNLNLGSEGIKELEQVVKLSRNNRNNSNFNLLSEALNDLTLFYQEVYEPKNAYKYFARVTQPNELADIILGLSDIYKRHSKYPAVNTVLTDFYKKNPQHENIDEFINELAWNYESLRDRKKATNFLTKLDKLCNQIKTDNCQDLISDSSLSLGYKWRNLWVKNNKNEIFGEPSEVAFRIFLANSKITKESLEVRFLLAEMLFARNKFRQASDEYFTVSKTETNKKNSHKSAYAAIVSLQKATKDKWNQNDQTNYNSLADYYLKQFKSGKYRLDVEFKKALIDYEKDNFTIAKPIFYKLGNKYKNETKGLKSQDLYLDILNSEQNYKAIKNYSKILLKDKNTNKKRISEVKTVYEQAYFLQIQNIEKSKDFNLAQIEYQKFYKENKASALAPKALWNSALMLVKQNMPSAAALQFSKYYSDFPKSKDAKNALLKSARLYEGTAELNLAAGIFQKLAKLNPTEMSKWLLAASEYYYIEGHLTKSLNILTDLAKKSEASTKTKAIDKLIQINKNSIKKKQSLNIDLMSLIFKHGNIEQRNLAYLKKANDQLAAKRYKDAFIIAKKVNKLTKNATTKSEATFIMAMVLKSELEQQSLKSSVHRVADVLALKINRLDKAQNYFLKAIKYANPDNNVLSMYNLAKCYKNYIESLRSMPTPRGLQANEEEGFRAEIENIIAPMEDKYVESLHQTYTTAKKQYSTDINLAQIQKELLSLQVSLGFKNLSKYRAPSSELLNIDKIPNHMGGH